MRRSSTFWYDAAWRVVQETQRDQTNGAGPLEESVIQQAWGARYIIEAVAAGAAPSGARIARASRRSGERSDSQIAFQLTDAQFSVIAVATPGKPGVVIDRIAYSAYGEATRTLRSDVNGDGFVNKDDYNGVIRARLNTTIDSSGYVVEADLDRDGKVAQSDYDIAVADDGRSSSGGVGEAGLFAKGVRNGVGYCGYMFNDESGLYTVRFRSYSPTLGRWLERDPAGYVDGANLYQYVRADPIRRFDPLGLQTDGVDIKFQHWMRARERERKEEATQPPSSPNPLTLYVYGKRSFNDTERALWRETGLYEKLCLKRAYDVAMLINRDPKYADGIVNGPGDAVRHCTWNCLMTKCLGRKGAQRWGDAHEESTPPGLEDEREMDLHNNQQGRDIYSELVERNWDAWVKSIPVDDSCPGDVVPDTDCKTACEEALAAGRLKVLEKSKWSEG